MTKKHKRNLFAELSKGIKEINDYKKGKITLRTYAREPKALPKVDAKFIRETREWLNMSRNVFAIKLHISPRTLEKWEQGKTVPNDQASALILLTRKYPDTLLRLEKINII
ncbi:MAG TPA: transcriptional regulator [Coxiellaceae bacterium]|nr:transcriptional regulator [Coxiellaceae bacterium]HBS51855.1 transcriptional regulator [Coxiellaceae bacterium]HBY55732.1 transcriptional regulator [Coxiellaceae bacterium]